MNKYTVIVYNDAQDKSIRFTGHEAEDKDVARRFGEAVSMIFYPWIKTSIHVIYEHHLENIDVKS